MAMTLTCHDDARPVGPSARHHPLRQTLRPGRYQDAREEHECIFLKAWPHPRRRPPAARCHDGPRRPRRRRVVDPIDLDFTPAKPDVPPPVVAALAGKMSVTFFGGWSPSHLHDVDGPALRIEQGLFPLEYV